jgi:hypothetical protein
MYNSDCAASSSPFPVGLADMRTLDLDLDLDPQCGNKDRAQDKDKDKDKETTSDVNTKVRREEERRVERRGEKRKRFHLLRTGGYLPADTPFGQDISAVLQYSQPEALGRLIETFTFTSPSIFHCIFRSIHLFFHSSTLHFNTSILPISLS